MTCASITLVLAFSYGTSSEMISTSTWTNGLERLSAEIRDYKSHGKTTESTPAIEGFIPLSSSQKKHRLPAPSTSDGRTVPSRVLYNVTSTTCKTIHQRVPTRTSTTLEQTPNDTLDQPSPSYRSRRLLNIPSYDAEPESFLKVDPVELSRQMFEMAAKVDGSGFSTLTSDYMFHRDFPFSLFVADETTTDFTTGKDSLGFPLPMHCCLPLWFQKSPACFPRLPSHVRLTSTTETTIRSFLLSSFRTHSIDDHRAGYSDADGHIISSDR